MQSLFQKPTFIKALVFTLFLLNLKVPAAQALTCHDLFRANKVQSVSTSKSINLTLLKKVIRATRKEYDPNKWHSRTSQENSLVELLEKIIPIYEEFHPEVKGKLRVEIDISEAVIRPQFSAETGISETLAQATREILQIATKVSEFHLRERSRKLQAELSNSNQEFDIVVIGGGPLTSSFANHYAQLIRQNKSHINKIPRVLIVSKDPYAPHMKVNYLLNSGDPLEFGRGSATFTTATMGFPANPFVASTHLPFGIFTGAYLDRNFAFNSSGNNDANLFSWTLPQEATPVVTKGSPEFSFNEVRKDKTYFDTVRDYIEKLGGRFVEIKYGPDGQTPSAYGNSGLVYMPLKFMRDATILGIYESDLPLVAGIELAIPKNIDGQITQLTAKNSKLKINLAKDGIILDMTGVAQTRSSKASFEADQATRAKIEHSYEFNKRTSLKDLEGKDVLLIGRGDSANVSAGIILGVEENMPKVNSQNPAQLHWSKLSEEEKSPQVFRSKLNSGTNISRGNWHDLRYEPLSKQLDKVSAVDARVQRIQYVAENKNFVVELSDGTKKTYDVVVDASGVPSQLPQGAIEAVNFNPRIGPLRFLLKPDESSETLSPRFAEDVTIGLKYSQSNYFVVGPQVITNLVQENIPSTNFVASKVGGQFGINDFTQGAFVDRNSPLVYEFKNPSAHVNGAWYAANFAELLVQQSLNSESP